ncbi:MAG: hypothetical protein ACLPVY_17470 [Acidimicrobiia bacterium]
MRATRLVARAIGWLFVAAIGYHAVLAVIEAVQAGDDGDWTRAGELIAIAIVATAIVVAAVIGAASRRSTRTR